MSRRARHAKSRQDQQGGNAGKKSVGLHFTTSVARMAVWPAPQGREHSMMNVPGGVRDVLDDRFAAAALWNLGVDVGADDAEAVIGVVAGEMEFDRRALRRQ